MDLWLEIINNALYAAGRCARDPAAWRAASHEREDE
jgi:hypothetical protein